MDLRSLCVMLLLTGHIHIIQTAENPKPELTSNLKGAALTGNSVTLTCSLKLQSAGWKFYWDTPTKSTETETHSYTIRSVRVSDGGQYRCRAGRGNPVYYTHYSDALWVNVTESPKPVVIINPDTQVYRGETVTFRCNVQTGGDTEWTYDWYKNDNTQQRDTTQELIISSVRDSDGGKYTCRGRRRDSQLSQISHPVTLSVSAKPKPTVRVNSQSSIYTGDRVTLSCDLQSTGWTFFWDSNQQSRHLTSVDTHSNTLHVTVSNDRQIKYYCKAHRGNYESERSDPTTITVRARPQPVVKVHPAESVFIGERVTLTCEIQTGGFWQYHWYRDNKELRDERWTTYKISKVKESNKGDYTCKGTKSSDPKYTQTSAAVTLTVSESPKPVVIIKPDTQVFRGEKVTFRCDIQTGGDTEWTYSWYKNTYTQSHRTAQEFNINSVKGYYDGGKYTCRGRRRDSQLSQISDAVTLSVSEKPKPTVRVNPQSSIYTGDRVTLSCDLEGPGWTFLWYKDYQQSKYQKPVDIGSNTLNVTFCNEERTTYYCKAHRGDYESERSDPATITVGARPQPVVKVHPAESVLIGENVTLTCVIGGSWQYHWYRDNKELSDAAGEKTYTINDVKESNEGDYTCNGTQSSDPKYTQTSAAVTLTVSETLKPALTSPLKRAALTGNSVTLTCTLELPSAGWKFYWIKDTQNNETETNSYTIKSVSVSDGGQYRCRAGRGNPVYYTHYSNAIWVNVTESPKAVVSIRPDNHVFRGERVTLKCEIQGGGDTEWTYSWYKNDYLLDSDQITQEFNLSPVTIDNGGKYTCRGKRSSDSQSSEISDALTLTVSDPAETVVSVSPLSWLTEGDSVTLSCEVKHSSTGWTFSWYTDVPYRDSQGSLRYRTALLSDSSRGSGGSYTLSPVTLNHTGVYMCRAERGEPAFHTHYSEPQPLCVTVESPPVSLIISPSRTQHFTTDSLSLSCEDQRDSTGWTVRGHTHSETLYNCPLVSGSTCYISSLSTSHTGVYWCQSESGGRSNSLNITIHDGDVILESPVRPVTEGNLLTLQCLYRSKISDSRVDFYKNNSLFQKQTTGKMTIRSVSKSDEGFYHCTHPERGESPKSWVSVRVSPSGSSGVVVGLSLVFMFTILIVLLILLLHYKKQKVLEVVEYQTPSAVNRANFQAAGGDPIYENAALRSTVDSAAGSSNTMYSQVVMWKKYHKGEGNEMYSQIEMKNIRSHDKDAVTEPSDVTYVEIDLTNQTKQKIKQEKHSEEEDTVYSELNQNTDQEDFGETADETYAQVNRKRKRDNAGS
ncbi:basement membrane-specific heparan sulfate proteoglycan core protein-like [Clarias gariepinus]|uniref:basement membrane-specific heparan sulfate proteoglycan core protein-like n=1 Tax=Clarias gariepinus TaxID=13013 RepID=UPI00234D1E9D|nr:basement membrane-specific heparan sulfate proteoglycan core protein-like [Clarias gariepinus]